MNSLEQLSRSGTVAAEFISYERGQSKPADFVSLQDYEDAIAVLQGKKVWIYPDRTNVDVAVTMRLALSELGPVGHAWVQRMVTHLHAKVDRYFRDGPNLHDPKQALAYIKTMAMGYREGAQALEWAAARLSKKHGDSHGANETHKAAVAMARAAQELIGED